MGKMPKEGKLVEYSCFNRLQINKAGKYPLSSIPNVSSIKIIYDKDKEMKEKERLRKIRENNRDPESKPEPMKKLTNEEKLKKWKEEQELLRQKFAKKGVSFLGKYDKKDQRSKYPGPGSYNYISDFGTYLSKDWEKYPKENVYEDDKPKQEVDPRPWRHGMKIIKE